MMSRPRRSPLVAQGALVAIAIACRLARADAPAAPTTTHSAASALVPPRPITEPRVSYPASGTGDADVVITIVLNADGSFRSARVLSGDEPFAGATLDAAPRWTFEPATRDGRPVSATIKVRIHFTAPPPAVRLPGKAVGSSEPGVTPKAPPSADASEIEEVRVNGDARAVGAQSLGRAEVRLLPGAFGDPFRAIDVLPGVTPIISGIPFFFVRGAPPGNVGYFLDGIRVPLLYHVGLGPSVIHPALMDRVDLYPGGYPARFGRFAGGIVAGETADPPHDWHGEANIRLVDSGAMLEGPLPKDAGTFFAAGRYSTTGLLLSLLSPNVSLSYWDYQGRMVFDLTPRDQLTVFAFGAYDYLASKENGVDTPIFDTTFHRVDVRYDHRYGGPDDHVRTAVTLGYDETGFDHGSYAGDYILGARSEIAKRVSDAVVVRAGADLEFDDYQADLAAAFPSSAGFTSLFSDRTDFTMGVRADAVVALGRRTEVTPGVRLDFFESKGQTAIGVDPRLAARIAITRDVRLLATEGLASQPPSFVLPGPGFTRDLTGGLQRSWQQSVGVEGELPWDVTYAVTGFENSFFNMTDALGTLSLSSANLGDNLSARVNGSAFGMELLLKRRLTRRLGGVVSYTLSRSVRDLPTGIIPSSFDRTHVLNVAGSYDFGGGYRGGTRLVFYTGYPIDVLRPEEGRIPPFARFDFRLEKRWSVFSGRGWVSVVLEVENTFGAQETVQEQCVSLTTPCNYVQIGPVTIPSLGVEGGF